MLRKQAVFDREAFLALPDLPSRLRLWGEDRELEDFLTQKAFAIKPLPGSVPRADGEVKIAVVGSEIDDPGFTKLVEEAGALVVLFPPMSSFQARTRRGNPCANPCRHT